MEGYSSLTGEIRTQFQQSRLDIELQISYNTSTVNLHQVILRFRKPYRRCIYANLEESINLSSEMKKKRRKIEPSTCFVL